eukprot:CAMPEP_0115359134 /NCGR_PEP_ID=MMETSP0270-20121206/101015_1 /TAXON_ID=71861 /ORGANISM="Scrippsiella trochoidea, Strain CCMP3099" /LENGTH=85 /DNA_ID=CAMNT_0002781629 /DNA_START=242 /DNA_END=499 /DNA_ORIENTATION=-
MRNSSKPTKLTWYRSSMVMPSTSSRSKDSKLRRASPEYLLESHGDGKGSFILEWIPPNSVKLPGLFTYVMVSISVPSSLACVLDA